MQDLAALKQTRSQEHEAPGPSGVYDRCAQSATNGA